MRSFSLRAVLLQVHLWTGLVLGILFVALGLTGSILVYRDGIENLLAPVPHASATGTPQSLDALIAAARDGSGAPKRASAAITMPEDAGEPAIVRFQSGRPGMTGPGTGTVQVYIDPVNAQVLGTRKGAMSPLIQFAHDLHGQLFMGREGRTVVGWLGVFMLGLGISGIVLWWPKTGQWKNAFRIRRTSRGWRFHRELHGAVGIWFWFVFVLVSFSGIAIVFPATIGALAGGTGPAPTYDTRTGPPVERIPGARRIGADEAANIARASVPAAEIASVSIPAKPDQAIRVGLRATGDSEGLTATVFVDPWAAKAVAVRNPQTGAQRFVAWQRPIHEGAFGPVWQFLVFLSGLLPLLFVITGLTMWLKKRAGRAAAARAGVVFEEAAA